MPCVEALAMEEMPKNRNLYIHGCHVFSWEKNALICGSEKRRVQFFIAKDEVSEKDG